MKLASLVLVAALVPTVALAADAAPKFTEVAPVSGKAGAEFTITGENLTKTHVAEVYFTDGKNDVKCDIVDQQATTIKVKAPAKVAPGRFSLMILTADRSRFLEQPVKVTIE
jgi:hypothetical protein